MDLHPKTWFSVFIMIADHLSIHELCWSQGTGISQMSQLIREMPHRRPTGHSDGAMFSLDISFSHMTSLCKVDKNQAGQYANMSMIIAILYRLSQ